MENVYIKTEDLNKWIAEYFPNKDIISIDDLIGKIEDLDFEIKNLKEEIEDMKAEKEEDKYQIWRDRELEREYTNE